MKLSVKIILFSVFCSSGAYLLTQPYISITEWHGNLFFGGPSYYDNFSTQYYLTDKFPLSEPENFFIYLVYFIPAFFSLEFLIFKRPFKWWGITLFIIQGLLLLACAAAFLFVLGFILFDKSELLAAPIITGCLVAFCALLSFVFPFQKFIVTKKLFREKKQ